MSIVNPTVNITGPPPTIYKPEPEPEKRDNVPAKSKPVKNIAVPASPWCIVWTGDNKQFFYNPSKKASVWEVPDELKVGCLALIRLL